MGGHSETTLQIPQCLICPMSAWLEQETKDGGRFTAEGIDAHRLLEHVLMCDKTGAPDPRPQLSHYCAEMERAVQFAASHIKRLFGELTERGEAPVMMVEQWVDLSNYAPGGKGQVDCIIMADGELYVIDYKYGVGIEVNAKNNEQLLSYALGALDSLAYPPFLSAPRNVQLIILQPRRYKKVSTWTVSVDSVLDWGETKLKPSAFLFYCGVTVPENGEWCRNCPVGGVCRVRSGVLAKVTSEASHNYAPQLLTRDEICSILNDYQQILSFLEALKEYVIREARKGEVFPGFNLVKKSGGMTFTHKEEVAKILKENGIHPYENRVISVASAAKQLEWSRLNSLLGSFIQKAPDRYSLERIDESEIDEEL